MAFELGQTIGEYEFIDILRSSKKGVAYKVRNALAQRFEVLRIVTADLDGDQERAERFLREIKIHARLNHPNILTFYGASRLEEQIVMTTEYVEGVTLEDRLEIGAIPWQEALEIAVQVLAALHCAHSLGIVHREVTPANILLTTDGPAKLMGFGMAKALADPKLTQTGALIGAIQYMSPEQVRGEENLDGRADLYSFGVVLYEMLTGRRPFESKSQFEVMLAHCSTAPPPPREFNPLIPEELESIVIRSLAKEPNQRWVGASDFRSALLRMGGAPEEFVQASVSPEENSPGDVEETVPAAVAAPVAAPVVAGTMSSDARAFVALAGAIALIGFATLVSSWLR